MKRLIAAHLFGNAILLWFFYTWLGMSEATGWSVLKSAGTALFIVFGALWLHGSAFVEFQQKKLIPAKHLLPLFVFAAFIVAVYIGLDWAYRSFGHDAFVIGSYSTMKLRRPVAPSGVLKGFHVFIWILRWIVVPVLALPIASEIANHGWNGLRKQALITSKKPLYWLECVALLLIALWVPLKLFFWLLPIKEFWLEFASLALRVGVGYLFFVSASLALEFFTTAGGRPDVTQPSTAVAP